MYNIYGIPKYFHESGKFSSKHGYQNKIEFHSTLICLWDPIETKCHTVEFEVIPFGCKCTEDKIESVRSYFRWRA